MSRIQVSSLLAMTLFVPLSPTKDWVFDLLLLLALSLLTLPWWIGLLRRPHDDSFHQGVHALALRAWWLTSGTSGSHTYWKGLLVYGQGASESLPHPSPGREVDASVFGIAVRTLFQATPLTCSHGIPYTGPGLSVSAFKGCSSALKSFSF